jgi:hypothetical protein
MAAATHAQNVNIELRPQTYRSLETIALQEHRSVPETALELIEEGLLYRASRAALSPDITSNEIAVFATEGGAFSWLADEPDLYAES